MSCSPNGKNLFAAVITFCIGAISVSIITVEPSQPVVAPRSLLKNVMDHECKEAGTESNDSFLEKLQLWKELARITSELEQAKTEQEKTILRERELSLRSRLALLEMQRRIERRAPITDTTTKLVYREVCYER